jgi:hypothetical protein
MFQLRDINQMEHEMCGYLEWHLNIDYVELEQFTEQTQLEFGSSIVATRPIVDSDSSTSNPHQSPTAPHRG